MRLLAGCALLLSALSARAQDDGGSVTLTGIGHVGISSVDPGTLTNIFGGATTITGASTVSFGGVTTTGIASNAGSTGGITLINGINAYDGTTTIPFSPSTLPAFFNGEQALNDGVYYLRLSTSIFNLNNVNSSTATSDGVFGYYTFLSDPHYIYHFDMGYEYVFDANDGQHGVYFYDFSSGTFFYTSPFFPFPYMYDFSLNSVVYYYPDPDNAGRYNTDGVRYFYVFHTGEIISK